MTSYSSTNSNNPAGHRDGIVLQGYHKKLKTMKKKYFVLCSENGVTSARLEYYDSEKKFKSRSNPKRMIILKNCFNINRRLDTKHNCVIALSTKEEVFCIVLETEGELNEWLKALLSLQRGEDTDSDQPKPFFEHVWQVQMQRKGLADEKGIIGKYYVCLTAKSLTLVRIGSQTTTVGESRLTGVEFYLTTIRRCGDSQCFFYMEVGRHSAIGAGELWMQTEDPLIAQNMHTMIINAMSSTKNLDDGFGPISRKRSSSANEASKPISMTYRRQTLSGNKGMNSSPLSGTTLGRERCDSLPSRNRTASECSNNQIIINPSMPPPIRPTLSNRPHSMYTNRHSHSPPLNTLSPSTGCSESDGSSLSIDEPDSFGHSLTPDESGNFVGRYYNTHSSGGVIPEENCDDLWYLDKRNSSKLDNLNNISGRLTLPISTNHSVHNMRKSSPATSHIGSADMQSQYMDMFSPYSPSGSSPCDQPGSGFMPVSPGTDFPRGLYTGSSGGHSRASSLAEETVDGYVPMCPSQLSEYVDMQQSTKQHHVSGLSLAASSCSITSGTPSTDLRFAEYPLDKVKSRFTPDDEDLHPANERPIRAYSVGSRPEHIKRKLRVEALNNTAEQNNSRVRAFSVGSRAKVPRCDLYRGVFAPSLISCHANNNNNNNNNNIETIIASTVAAASKSKKSSSAPILVHKSQSSVDRMSDLMEIDFSKNSEYQNDSSNSSHSQPSPVRLSSFPLSVPITQQKRDFFENSPKSNSGYLAMKPASYTDKSTPIGQKSLDSSGYLEMRPISATKNSSLSSSPIKASTSVPKSIVSVCEDGSYMNMSPSTSLTSSETHRIDTEDYINVSPHDQHMDMDCFITNSTNTPEGYIEMNWNRLSRCNDNETITNTGSGELNRRCGEIRTGRELRNVSSPIDIKSKDNKSSGLTLSEAFSKLPRRTDSRESDIVTPIASHSNTIFPFSPGSPVKPFAQNDFASKCLVDATSGTVTLSEDNSNLNPSINQNASVTTAMKKLNTIAPDNTKILNTDSKMPKKYAGNLEALSNDYADMSLGSSKIKTSPKKSPVEKMECSDYVNYVPPEKTVVTKPIKINPNRDYAIMSQKATTSQKVTPVVASTSASTLPDVSFTNKKHLLVTVGNGPNESTSNFTGFRPIASSTDESFLRGNNTRKASSPKSGITSHLNRQLSDKSRNTDENSSGYELLQMRSDSSLQTKKSLPRPNSVNSEKISPSKTVNRPNSANSECMPSISTSSSTSTLCGSSSSSSTLCGSKSQSPLACSRLQSFSDVVAPSGSTSRPESVSSIADPSLSSRPPSVSSERGLYYASLDLPPSTSNIISTSNSIDSQQNAANSSSNALAKGNSSTSGDSSTSPSPNANGCQQQPTFTYAQIDFNKSESLKMAINAGNNQ